MLSIGITTATTTALPEKIQVKQSMIISTLSKKKEVSKPTREPESSADW